MAKKIFITRQLEIKSPLLEFALTSGHEVVGQSLIQITRVTFEDFPITPWVFFYSKNGVKHFVEQLESNQTQKLKNCKIGVIGSKTESIVMKYLEQSCDFVGNADQSNIEEFLIKLGSDKCLFPRASYSKKTIEKVLPEDQVESLVVYDNILDDFAIVDGEAAVLIFTSSMNVDAYLLHMSIDPKQTVVSIGHTTHDHLEALGYKNQKAHNPSEEGIVSLLKDIL